MPPGKEETHAGKLLRRFRRRSGCGLQPRCVHLDAFCARLSDLGYRRPTIRDKLGVVADLTRWIAEEHLAVADLDERRVDQFLDTRRRRGRTRRGFRPRPRL